MKKEFRFCGGGCSVDAVELMVTVVKKKKKKKIFIFNLVLVLVISFLI